MKKLLSSAVAAFVLGITASGSAIAGGDIANGEALSGVCAACHGEDGNSPSADFPKLAGLGEKYLLKQLKDIQSGEREILEMTGQLDGKSEQELADLAAFYASKSTQLSGSTEFKVQLNSSVMVDSLKLGAKVYRSGNLKTNVPACSGCHSPTGMGNAPAGFPRLSGQHADYIEKQLRAFRAGDRKNDGDARIMRSVAEHMSDAEIQAVANYIAGLN